MSEASTTSGEFEWILKNYKSWVSQCSFYSVYLLFILCGSVGLDHSRGLRSYYGDSAKDQYAQSPKLKVTIYTLYDRGYFSLISVLLVKKKKHLVFLFLHHNSELKQNLLYASAS